MTTKISLKQMRYLVALEEKRHFRRAAEAEGVTQPSLSAQIAELEDLLNMQLVERGRRPVTFTSSGREIVARARRVVDEVQGLQDLAATLRDGDGGTLFLGSSFTIGPYLLPTVLRTLHSDHPDLSLYIREGTPADLEQEILAGTHDVVLTQLPVRSPELEVVPIFREPLFLVVSHQHPLADREAVSRSDMSGLNILTLGPKYALHLQVSAICHDVGATVLTNYEGTSLDGLRQMVGMEMGASLMPATYVASEVIGRDPSVVAVAFRNGAVHRTMGLVWRKSSGRIDALAAFYDSLRRSLVNDFQGVLIDLDTPFPA